MTQLVTRVDDQLVGEVDRLVAEGVVATRSEAVRLGLESLVSQYRRSVVGARIVAGYRQHPQTEHEVGWADEATRRMIADETW
jgi:metal-responsive CopG/Arc/MetJ family transcriptional regulator